MSRKVYLATFGCRTNQADSAAIRDDFLRRGFEETDCCAQADVIVVNSCTVTHRSDQQVRQLSRRLRRENNRATMVVTGCYAQRAPEILAQIRGIDAVIGNTHRSKVVEVACDPTVSIHNPNADGLAPTPAIYRDEFDTVRVIDRMPAARPGSRTRPFVKIQDGCDAKCSYCIIPAVRGPSRSVLPPLVLDQVRDLAAAGFKEIVLTGIHMGTYGLHLRPRFTLDRLLEELVSIPQVCRIRLSSLEPMELSTRVIDLAVQTDRIAPHFHICLQSGSDRILTAMRRPYRRSRFARIVEDIRKRLPHAGIGTDVIVGFPGETEEDHRATLDFVNSMPFTYLHVFPYSDRPGTAASRLGARSPAPTVGRRSQELRQVSEAKNREFRKWHIGRRVQVLTLSEVEREKRVALSGNYLRVLVPLEIPPNTLVEGRVTGENKHGLNLAPTA